MEPQTVDDLIEYLDEDRDSAYVLLVNAPNGISIQTTMPNEEMRMLISYMNGIMNGNEDTATRH